MALTQQTSHHPLTVTPSLRREEVGTPSDRSGRSPNLRRFEIQHSLESRPMPPIRCSPTGRFSC